MLMQSQLLQAASQVQTNAQTALPVIPNNGNPGGVYNMPTQPASPQAVPTKPQQIMPTKPAVNYDWLKPSAAMADLRQRMSQWHGGFNKPLAEQPVHPRQLMMEQERELPVIPNRMMMTP